MTRPYTAAKAPVASGPLAGNDEFIRQVVKRSMGSLWNNGSFIIRDIRTKPGQLSNHARGLATDFSYRKMTDKGLVDGRKVALPFIYKLLENADVLQMELVIDYHENRSWKCDRATWIKGKWSGGDWFHIEISPAMANDANLVKQAFQQVFKDMPKTNQTHPTHLFNPLPRKLGLYDPFKQSCYFSVSSDYFIVYIEAAACTYSQRLTNAVYKRLRSIRSTYRHTSAYDVYDACKACY